MATFLQNAGKTVAKIGGVASLVAGRDLRLGGGAGIGARIGGQSQPYFSVNQPSTQVLSASQYVPPQSSQGYPNPSAPSNPINPGATGTGAAPTYNLGGQENTISNNANDMQALADQEFEQALRLIGEQEGAIRQSAGVEEQRQTFEGEKAVTRAGEAKQAQLSGLEGEQATAEKSASSGLRQARDLFRQIQQQNIAQVSGLGISSSSVTEALAERLGVETAQRIAGVTGSLEEVRQNVSKEKTRLETVFQSKLTEIQEGTKLAIDEVRAGLAQALTSLSAERGRAATAKAQARTEIAVNARNAIQAIQLQAQERQASITAAAQRRAQALAEAEATMFRPTDMEGINRHVANVGTMRGFNGYTPVPTFENTSVQGQGFIRPGVSYERNYEEEQDEL